MCSLQGDVSNLHLSPLALCLLVSQTVLCLLIFIITIHTEETFIHLHLCIEFCIHFTFQYASFYPIYLLFTAEVGWAQMQVQKQHDLYTHSDMLLGSARNVLNILPSYFSMLAPAF